MLKTIIKCWTPHPTIRCYAKLQTEMKYLNVAEKNDAAKTIAGLLSRGSARRREGYSVYNKIYEFETNVKGQNSKMIMTSVSGHLMELEFLNAYRNWRNVDPQALFNAPVRKSCPETFQPIKRTLEREVRGCQGLIIWTDCDREGENIGFEIIDVCRTIKPNISVYRATFSEITTAAVQRALQQLGTPNKHLSDAVNVRSELDLRTGAAITRFQTMRLQRLFPAKIADKLISYGSCQIPTLGFVVERYKEIEAFVSEAFWKLKVLHTIDELTVEFIWARNRLFDKAACEDYLLLCLADPRATVEEVTVKPKNKWRPTALDTVEMEKLGSRKLKLSAKETMTIAEKLYTKGIISYPRTETNQFSKDINLGSLVEQQTGHSAWGSFAQRVMEWGPNPRNGNKSDQAHPPIHPTKLVTDLQGNEGRVYELICRHFLACVSKDAVGSETVVRADIAGEKFTATGLVIYERNYLDVYIYEKWNAKQIHNYVRGQVFEPTEISMQEGATTAPPLLTEADLIALMEKHGIGTDATHAEHINTIKERGYIGVVDNGCLVPGVIGMALYEGYDAMELALAKPVLRSEFEADLKKICTGEKDPQLVLSDQIQKYKGAYRQIMEKIAAMDDKVAQRLNETPATNAAHQTNAENGNTQLQELFQCPKCAVAALALRPKRNQTGYYIGCTNFPDCKNAIWLPEECKEPAVLAETCQHCGPAVKLLKLKFNTAYYKTLFRAPFGWYKTCLQCDSQFREVFNINLDSVKRAGAIVGEAGPASTTLPSRTSTVTTSSDGRTNQRGATNPTDKRKKTTAKTSTQSIRSFCTSTTTGSASERTSSVPSRTSDEDIVAAQLGNTALEDFFDSNDGFDDILRSIEVTPEAVEGASGSVGTSENRNVVHRGESDHFGGDFDESFTTLLRDAGDELDNFTWGTAAAGRTQDRRLADNSNTSVAKKARVQERVHSSEVLRRDTGSNVVRCNICYQEAKELTVRKEGPNKGKRFYVCPREKGCKFFQWVEPVSPDQWGSDQANQMPMNPATHQTHSSSFSSSAVGWGSASSALSDANNTSAPSGSTAKSNNAPKEAATDTHQIKCHCNVLLNRLTVRKDGPNKGRQFYACPNRENSCRFFKWHDEDDSQASSSTSIRNQSNQSLSSGSQNNSRSLQDHPDSRQRVRKCGLCRQPGHTKLKCPRKSEFEY